MKYLNFHKNFKLNSRSFKTSKDLISYTCKVSEESADFLKVWFDGSPFVVVKTSGSTGIPKHISLKKEHMVNSALATGIYFQLPKKTKALLCLSSKYIAGKMMWVRSLVLGWRLDLIAAKSNPSEDILKEYDFSSMLPVQLYNSLKKISKIKKIIVGGGEVSKELYNKIQTISTQIYATYGMTETITHIAVKKLNNFEDMTPACYEVLPNISPTLDSRGCLVIKAPLISEKVIITNDLVVLKSPRKFEWLGRFDTIINSGGVKLIPEEIEKKISGCCNGRFFISSLPDNLLGQKLILVVEGKQKKITDKNKIAIFLKDIDLSKFEIPKAIYFIPKFIETETKKIQKIKTLNFIR